LPHGADLAELRDLVGGETPLAEDLVGVLARLRPRSRDLARRAREAWRRRGLEDALVLDDRATRLDVRMLSRLAHRQHGREADVGAFEEVAPLVASLREEQLGEACAEHVGTLAWTRPGQVLLVEPGTREELGVELRFERAECDELAVLGLVRV